jgi:beta-1,4-N-acetylglucosaminyltransferase
LVIQYGKGKKPVLPDSTLSVECYDFKPSLLADMKAADLILSHAGAGTVMECLQLCNEEEGKTTNDTSDNETKTSETSHSPRPRRGRRLVVVINTILMDNHQTELADAMGQRKHLYVVSDPQLLAKDERTWDALESFQPVPKEPGDDQDFSRELCSFLGLNESDNNLDDDESKDKKKLS